MNHINTCIHEVKELKEKRKWSKRSKRTLWLPLIVVFIVDIAVFIISTKIDILRILEKRTDGVYSVSNSSLIIIVGMTIITAIEIIQAFTNYSMRCQYEDIDNNGHVQEEIHRVESHLINFDRNTIPFEDLSDVELSVGFKNKNVKNEIWILTNNFEEADTESIEAKELRKAIVSNLKTNVDYYYVIPSNCEKTIKTLSEILHAEIGKNKITGKFSYIIDDALEFIPTPYFDIDLYLVSEVYENKFAPSSSVIYYCFSRTNKNGEYFYHKVEKDSEGQEIWNRMTNYVKTYKESHSEGSDGTNKFTVLIGKKEDTSKTKTTENESKESLTGNA